jgi:hypothetical protein
MSPNPGKPAAPQQRIVDEAVLAYVEWREECTQVWSAYGWWASAPAEDARHAHAAYLASLDREEAAAKVYARLMKRVGHLVETGLDYPVAPGARSGITG